MHSALQKDRMLENEAIFRQYNEKVQQDIKKLEKLAKQEGYRKLANDEVTLLHFYCECSDENCTKRIAISPSVYTKIHRDRNRFILIPGHQALDIESIVADKKTYLIVKKFSKPPEVVGKLNPTPIENV